jgi:chemotaxis protein CheX
MTETLSPTLPSAAELGEIVEQVWSSFLDGELVVGAPPADGSRYAGRLVAWVSIGGDWTGHLMVVTPESCANQIAARMFEMEVGDVSTAEVADALGEIANMVGGSVKGVVGGSSVLSLPQVVLDASALVSPDAREVVSVHARWQQEPLEFSLWERQVNKPGGLCG